MRLEPICANCQKPMTCRKNEVLVREKGDPKARSGDLWECMTCHASIVTGFGNPMLTDETAVIVYDRHRGTSDV